MEPCISSVCVYIYMLPALRGLVLFSVHWFSLIFSFIIGIICYYWLLLVIMFMVTIGYCGYLLLLVTIGCYG